VKFDGKLAKLSISDSGLVATIVAYPAKRAKVPSAVLGALPGAAESQTIFAQEDRVVVDIALLPNMRAFIAAIEPPGNSAEVPVPAKLKMLQSDDLSTWGEMSVDYRAVARAATLAAPDARHVWVATDTGMILNLAQDGGTAR